MAALSDALGNWIKGAERKCSKCDRPIKNLQRDLGEVRSYYPGPRRVLVCYECHVGRSQAPQENP